ncbi:MAG: hypothetical protein KJO06_08275 [Gemmatimonadetes bacterium]|nr:hypothetical protein [Gemmatimonadota bacterium]
MVESALPCPYFQSRLESVPHVALSAASGRFVSDWDQEQHVGCQVDFETNDSLREGASVPHFDAIEGSEMHGLGWRQSYGIGADGPGSGIFGIEKGSTLCIIRWAQPAHIDDDGEIVSSDTFNMRIQCRQK